MDKQGISARALMPGQVVAQAARKKKKAGVRAGLLLFPPFEYGARQWPSPLADFAPVI
jgi:hypothetical protein